MIEDGFKYCPNCGKMLHPTVVRCHGCREWLVQADGSPVAEATINTGSSGSGESTANPALLLRWQNFYQAKTISLMLYVVLVSIIPAMLLFISSRKEENMLYLFISSAVIFSCAVIHVLALYHIRRFVKSNFEVSDDFDTMLWGTAISFFAFVILWCSYSYIDMIEKNDLKMILMGFILFSSICCAAFIVLLYEQISSSVEGFAAHIPWVAISYDLPEGRGKQVLGGILIAFVVTLFKIPAHLHLLFSEAELHSKKYGYAGEKK